MALIDDQELTVIKFSTPRFKIHMQKLLVLHRRLDMHVQLVEQTMHVAACCSCGSWGFICML